MTAQNVFRPGPDTGKIVPDTGGSPDHCRWVGPYGESMKRAKVTLACPPKLYEMVTVSEADLAKFDTKGENKP